MHDLVPLDTIAPGALISVADEHSALRDFTDNSRAVSTRAAYRADFAAFTKWCTARGLSALPASPQVVAWHISAVASAGLSVSSIGRRLAGIAYAHKLRQLPIPTGADEVKVILAGIRRTLGTAPKRKAAATADIITAMLKHIPTNTLKGKRDRALLSLGFAAALRRSELVAIEVGDLVAVEDGYRLTIRKSKTDQEGRGQEVPVLRGTRLRPVAVVREWLDAAGITEGLVFRAIRRGGRMKAQGLGGADVGVLVKHYARLAGLDVATLSAHSLRAGFCTSSAEAGVSIFSIMTVSRHKSMETVRGYVRSADLFKAHAGAAFL